MPVGDEFDVLTHFARVHADKVDGEGVDDKFFFYLYGVGDDFSYFLLGELIFDVVSVNEACKVGVESFVA